MDNQLHENVFHFVCQKEEQYNEMIQFFERRKLLNNKLEILYKPIPYTDQLNNKYRGFFLPDENDVFYMENVSAILPFIDPLNIIHLSVVGSTQQFLMDYDGPTENSVCIADEQLCGRTRSNKRWNSSLGCLMFSMKLPTKQYDCNIVEMAPHISALSLVLALESIPAFDHLDFKIAWPYDVYVNGKYKICGVINEICHSFDNTYAVVGIGVHVNNENTTCLKSLLQPENNQKLISRSFILSKFLIIFTSLYKQYCKYGFISIASLYYQHWLLLHQILKIKGDQEVLIQEISPDGYLIGIDNEGRMVELYPDVNCEDPLSNMIAQYF